MENRKMAMINCSECGNLVSSNATSCPNCGNPIAMRNANTVNVQHITIERTKKSLKAMGCLFSFITIIGLIFLFPGLGKENYLLMIIGSLISLGGVIGIIITKIKIWWNHG